MEHLREIYFDYNKAVIAIPLYLVAFCLHQACSNTDNRLALVHYYNLNDSLWENVRASGASSFGTEALSNKCSVPGYRGADTFERFEQLAEDDAVEGHPRGVCLAARFPGDQGRRVSNSLTIHGEVYERRRLCQTLNSFEENAAVHFLSLHFLPSKQGSASGVRFQCLFVTE